MYIRNIENLRSVPFVWKIQTLLHQLLVSSKPEQGLRTAIEGSTSTSTKRKKTREKGYRHRDADRHVKTSDAYIRSAYPFPAFWKLRRMTPR